MRKLLLSLFLACSALAQPAITSFTPDSADVAGNTLLTISGSGFLVGAQVYVRGAAASEITVVDDHTIRARTPIGLPGPAAITVSQVNGSASANGFTYTGNALTAYDRLLLPVFTPPVHGAYGSEFRSELNAWNSGTNSTTVRIYGLQSVCVILCPALDPLGSPIVLEPRTGLDQNATIEQVGNPGRFIYIPKEQSPSLGTFLRVYDVSREASNFGTEIRVVHANAFKDEGGFVFPSVPTDPRFRITLRVYGVPGAQFAYMILNGSQETSIPLRPSTDLFVPAYAEISDFPVGVGPIDIEVYPPQPPGGVSPPIHFPAVWAFLTVTNNETQQITTVTPN